MRRRLRQQRLASVEKRLAELESHNAIVALMHRYGRACDLPVGPERGQAVAACFSVDGVWEGMRASSEVNPRCDGREAIATRFSRTDRFTFTVHCITNAEIAIEKEGASGTFLNFGPVTYQGKKSYWQASRYENDFVYNETNGWLIKHLKAWPYMMALHDDGWAVHRYVALA